MGSHDLALITLDTLRYDVAVDELAAGRTPNLARLVGTWEQRHTPGSFTYAAHAAFFAGFLPTPARPGRHPRQFALRFDGSETIGDDTCVLDGASIVEGLALRGYHTLCVGGVGFFNQLNPLGRVFPSLFAEAHWSRATGVTDPRSFEHQIGVVAESARGGAAAQRAFTFINVAALHQPNHFYLARASTATRARRTRRRCATSIAMSRRCSMCSRRAVLCSRSSAAITARSTATTTTSAIGSHIRT